MYIPQNWELGSALSKLWNFGGSLNPSLSTPLINVLPLGKRTRLIPTHFRLDIVNYG
jgi:hypothetical protein